MNDYYSDRILTGLNPEQHAAVTYGDGPLLIFAGAGSGKTRVLTHRIAWLIQNHGVLPENVLAVTFTNKAANEMKDRIGRLIGRGVRGMMVGTFHAICSRLLRDYGEAIGVPKDFLIFDSDDQTSAVRKVMKELQIDDKQLKPSTALNMISNAKNDLLTPAKYKEENAKNPRGRQVAEIYRQYQKLLVDNHGLDFDDLIMKAVELLEKSEELLDKFHESIRYIFVDEFQDINMAQYRFIELLAQKYRNICVVGDDDQSIYAWRGADTGILLAFEKNYRDAMVIKLEQNYRSPQVILDAAWHVINKNTNRKDKKLWTEQKGGEKIKCYRAGNEHEEAAFIAKRIKELTSAGLNMHDIAVLYRVNALSRVLEQAMIGYAIPYRIIGGFRFFDRKEIKDIIAYLRVLYNNHDSISLRRIINTPPRGIGDTTIARLDEIAMSKNVSMFDVVMSVQYTDLAPRAKAAIGEFAKIMSSLQGIAATRNISELITDILKLSGYELSLENASRGIKTEKGALVDNAVQAETQLQNVRELISAAQEFEAEAGDEEGKSMHAFLEQVALTAERAVAGDSVSSVTLMSMHAAKGLEFDTVFIAGLEDGIFPLRRMWDVSPVNMEEERRLCYVGITRAKKQLYLSIAAQRMLYGKTEMTKVSQFFEDIPAELLTEAEPGRMMSRQKYETWNDITIVQRPSFTPKIEVDDNLPLAHQLRQAAKQFEMMQQKAQEEELEQPEPQQVRIPIPQHIPRATEIVQKAQASIVSPTGFRVGDRVKHNTFGEGILLQIDGVKFNIMFKGGIGTKKIDTSLVPVEKV
jgi:DNA helicase-2/ATP-dependent DNA helicase PcrA